MKTHSFLWTRKIAGKVRRLRVEYQVQGGRPQIKPIVTCTDSGQPLSRDQFGTDLRQAVYDDIYLKGLNTEVAYER